jgi:hypothetical protein
MLATSASKNSILTTGLKDTYSFAEGEIEPLYISPEGEFYCVHNQEKIPNFDVEEKKVEVEKKISLPFFSEMKLKCKNVFLHMFPIRLLLKILVARGNIKDWLFDKDLTVIRFTTSCLLMSIIWRLVRRFIFKRK